MPHILVYRPPQDRWDGLLDALHTSTMIGSAEAVDDRTQLVHSYRAHHADVVLLGVDLLDYTQAFDDLTTHDPRAVVMVVVPGRHHPRAAQALADGAKGLLRHDPIAAFAPPHLLPSVIPPPRPRRALTEQEHEVLVAMSDGLTNLEISWATAQTERAVKSHARTLFLALGARDRAHAVAIGMRIGLL